MSFRKLFWAVTAGFLVLQTVIQAQTQTNYLEPGTRKMAQRLRDIADTTDINENLFLNRERMGFLRTQRRRARTPETRLDTQWLLAWETLHTGLSEQALKEMDELEKLSRESHAFETNKTVLRLKQVVAWMRLGEQENCLTNHTGESCIFPIQGTGIHQLQRGSRNAIQILTNHLHDVPNDLAARWLLNVACMTVGEYPDKVPA